MATVRENEVWDRRWIRFFMQGNILGVADLKSAIRLVQLLVFHDMVSFKWPYDFTQFWGALEPLMLAEGKENT